ncbi:hypothetical protein HI914_01560 [Erysiphe necator]|nr:hypothetical protein HI914_01560 [Erysiphe necator]
MSLKNSTMAIVTIICMLNVFIDASCHLTNNLICLVAFGYAGTPNTSFGARGRELTACLLGKYDMIRNPDPTPWEKVAIKLCRKARHQMWKRQKCKCSDSLFFKN